MKFRLQDHILVPKHEVLSKEEAEELLKLLGVSKEQLPKIKASDPIVKEIGAKPGDIVKITRESLTAGKSVFYRLVVD
ncbi:MAG: DNA-directed RNA polymerase subunit H [Archaeoglobaceae archaeon]